jgi:hypothetical protein
LTAQERREGEAVIRKGKADDRQLAPARAEQEVASGLSLSTRTVERGRLG